MIEALLQAERLLVHGQVDQAEQIYASAIELDPRNAIAVVGMARVALEHGDDQLALDRARSALAIDPLNAAAQRLEARLAEVLEARAKRDATAAPQATHSPSESAFFTRNPSMADHQRMEEERSELPPAPTEPEQSRPGLLRRILGG